MGGEWPERVLSDLISVKHGWAFKGSFFDEAAEKGPIVVAIGNFNYSGGFRFDSTKIKRYTSDYPADYELIPGEILLAMTCQTAGGEILGIPGKVPDDGNTYLHNQRLGKVIVESEGVDDGYLYWLFLSKGFNHHLYCTATGTKILHTAPERILSYRFFLPSLPEQKTIAHILDSLDDKIQLNRQMNATLEAMAQALFKSWFVDFDPVIDKALAVGNPIPEPLRKRAEARRSLGDKRKPLPADVAQHFSDRFVFNEKVGWMPEGWKVTTIGKVSRCFDRKRIPLSKEQREEKRPGNIPYYGATSVMDYINEWIFNDIYLLVGEDGSVIKEDGTPFIQYIWGKTWVNNHAHVLQGIADVATEHLMLFMRYQNVSAYVTGAVQQKINQKNLNSIPFLKASDSLNQKFADMIAPYYPKIRHHFEETANLVNLRDTLLPKLLSGQLRIPDAEKLIGETAQPPR
ncbi:MAG: restriction endonuclease subunit S [Candidatus Electrothrix communis]|nr:MAG: restriction endonuclease subunit S [Candidatus Electrothrix communis]